MVRGAIGLVGVLALITACRAPTAEPAARVSVTRGALVFSMSFYGELEARKSIALHTPDLVGVRSLTIDTILADGTRVKKGDVVITFVKGPLVDDLRDLNGQLEVAKAELRRVAERLAAERIDLELKVKTERLRVERAQLDVVEGVNLISKLELAKAKLDVRQAQLRLGLAKKAMRSFAAKRRAGLEVQRLKVGAIEDKAGEKRKQLNGMELRAPAAGVVYGPFGRLNWVRGKATAGSVTRGGDKLMEIPDLTAYNVALYSRQRDAGLLNKGDRAKVYATMLPGKALDGRVTGKEDFATTRNDRLGTKSAEGNLKEIKVTLELKQAPSELRPGGTVRADISSTLAKDVVLMPLAAATEMKDGYQVVMADGTSRTVKLGRSSSTHAEVISGVKVGDKLRLHVADAGTRAR